MGNVLHLDATASERKLKQLADAARDRARVHIVRWLKEVEAKVRAGKLNDLDARFARALTNFPSANQGTCWAGQPRLAETLGKSVRTIGYCVKRLTDQRLLGRKQRGLNRSNIYTLQIDGTDLFPSRQTPSRQDRQRIAGQDRQEIADPDRQKVADYPFESESYENIDSKPTSSAASKRPREERELRCHELTDRVVLKLGRGSEDAGWKIYKQIPNDVRLILRDREREGTLDDAAITLIVQASKQTGDEGNRQ
jgi:hypothetical protein